MADGTGRTRVMLVTRSDRTAAAFARLLAAPRYAVPLVLRGADAARRAMLEAPCDIVIIDTPLSDDFGIRLAEDLTRYETTGILLLVDSEQYEPIACAAGESGVLTLSRPLDEAALRQALGLLAAMTARLRRYAGRAETLQARMEEIALVNRAKLLLMEKRGLSEGEAHRFIEKSAMDRCLRRREIAREIIECGANI